MIEPVSRINHVSGVENRIGSVTKEYHRCIEMIPVLFAYVNYNINTIEYIQNCECIQLVLFTKFGSK